MSEHTPGPWKSGAHATIPGRFAIRHESGGVIVGHTWDEANARLIAAAPELLEALIEANDHLGGRDELHHKIIALIAKATGGAE